MIATKFLPLFTGFYGSVWDDVDFYGEDDVYTLPEWITFDDMHISMFYKDEINQYQIEEP